MSDFPAFSIILPVFNTVLFLQECIESILAQSFRDFELLLIDDGSTDGSTEVCADYAAADRRITFQRQANRGVSAARNLGLSRARGDYVWMVDSDDRISPRSLEVLKEHTASRADIYVFNQADRRSMPAASFHELLEMHLDYQLGFQCWNKIYSRLLLDGVSARFDHEISIGEDLLFNVMLYAHTTHVEMLPVELYHYREHSASAMRGSALERRFREHMKVHSKVLEQSPIVDPLQKSRLFLLHLMSGIGQSGSLLPDSRRVLADEVEDALRNRGRGAFSFAAAVAFLRAEEAGPLGWARLLAVKPLVRWGRFGLSSRILVH